MIDFKNILNYLNGNLSEKEKDRFLLLLDSSDELKEEFDFAQRVNECDIKDIKLFDVDEEWDKIEKRLEDKDEVDGKYRFLRIISIAASILLVGLLINYLFTEKPMFTEIVTTNSVDTIRLVDGSIVYLGENSKLKYFVRQDRKTNRRFVEFEGSAIFDIAHNKDLPFVLKTKGAGIDVLGTVFKIEQVPAGIGVENMHGLINLFEWENASNSMILKEGEKALFTEDGIQKILPKPEKVEIIGRYYKIEDILDFLFDKFDYQIATAPYADVVMEDKVFINLEQPLNNILSQLDTTAIIKYRKTCKNCFEISVLKSK